MKKLKIFSLLLLVSALILPGTVSAKKKKKDKSPYQFSIEIEHPRMPIKNQGSSSTCWSYSGTSFLESEIQRIGQDPVELSVMFTVMNTYREKADRYVRWHGQIEFGPGGAFHDVIHSIRKFGIVPYELYLGNEIEAPQVMHGEMDGVLKGYMDGVIQAKIPSSAWRNGFDGLVKSYLGETPEQFTYKGQTYTPQSFAISLGLNLDDYVEISSFTHHPYYQSFVLEVPDNWLRDEVYNVPLDDLIAIMDHAIRTGYTVAWASDLETGFNFGLGVAVVPPDDWDGKTYKAGMEPLVSAERRQMEFDNYKTTDDHGMHLVGIAHDQLGNKYYLEKNSWGPGNPNQGYSYISETYIRLKTTNIMVNKNSIPAEIREKLGL